MASKNIYLDKNISARDQIDLARDLSILLQTGVTLNESLKMILEQARSKKIKTLIEEMLHLVERGSTLSVAIKKSSLKLNDVFVSMVKAGEASGTLSRNLLFTSEWLERNLELKKNIKSVTLYPKIVMSAAFFLGMMLSIFILPRLIPVFTGMNMELPLITRMVLSTAVFFREYTLEILFGILALFILYKVLFKVNFTKRIIQKLYLKIPFFGNLIKSYELALCSQLMSVLLKSGLTINESFDVAASESKNLPYEDSFSIIKKRLIQGVPLSESIKNFKNLYPNNFPNVILVGEKTGTLEASFSNLADYYNRDIKMRTRDLPTILEPILLVVIGVVVGIIALSIILPIYTLSSGLQ